MVIMIRSYHVVQSAHRRISRRWSAPGGMLDDGPEIVTSALQLRQSHRPPAGATPEAQVAPAEAWAAAIAYAALLHGVGNPPLFAIPREGFPATHCLPLARQPPTSSSNLRLCRNTCATRGAPYSRYC